MQKGFKAILLAVILFGGCTMTREYNMTLQEAFTRGLRANLENARNAEALIECRNWRVTRHGLAEPILLREFWPRVEFNGNFDTAAGWSGGAGWVWGGGAWTHAGGVADWVLCDAPYYVCGDDSGLDWAYITITTTGIAGGSITPYIGAQAGDVITTNGTFYQLIQVPSGQNQIGIWGEGAAGASSIEVRFCSLSSNLVLNGDFAVATGWTAGSGWTIAGGVATHTVGTATLYQEFPDIKLRQDSLLYAYAIPYQVIYTVSGRTVGDITVGLGSGSGTARSSNATFTEIIFCTGAAPTLSFTPSNDFDGSIDNVSVKLVQHHDWPFPILCEGDKGILAFFNGAVYDVNATPLVPTLVIHSLYAARNPAAAATIHEQHYGIWQYADFMGNWFATNGYSFVYKIPSTDGGSGKTVVDETISVSSLCRAHDRLFLGGFTDNAATIFSSSRWAALWEQWLSYTDDEIFTYEGQEIGTNWVMWSRVLGGEYYTPFGEEMAVFQIPDAATFDDLKTDIDTDLETREIGFAEMPWQGNIYAMKPLGRAVIVYGDEGIAAMVLTEQGYRVQQLARFGIASRGAVTGDEGGHVLVDKRGNIFVLTPELQLQRLDYLEFGSQILDTNLLCSNNPLRQEVYLCKDGQGYLLSKEGGLSQPTVLPTSIVVQDNDFLAPLDCYDDECGAIAETDTFDMGIRDYKTIQSVEVAATDVSSMFVVVEARVSGSSAWTTFAAKQCNNEGVAVVIASGVEFRIKVYGQVGADPKMDYVNVHWKLTGKRYIRGIY